MPFALSTEHLLGATPCAVRGCSPPTTHHLRLTGRRRRRGRDHFCITSNPAGWSQSRRSQVPTTIRLTFPSPTFVRIMLIQDPGLAPKPAPLATWAR
jgi:hypothetical protein